MTRADHPSGTDRLAEAYAKIGGNYDVVVNVQGDEPFIRPEQINDIVGIFTKYPDTRLATLARPYPQDRSYEGLEDPNMVKLVMGDDGRALYFSRSVIPYLRGVDKKDWPARHQYYSHIGIYAYTWR